MNTDQKFNLLVILSVEITLLMVLNVTRVIWKITETTKSEELQIACLQGGGMPIVSEANRYLKCLSSKIKPPEIK